MRDWSSDVSLPILHCWLSRCRPTRSRREARYGPSGRRAAPVVLVRLLLHVARAQRQVDLLLDPRPRFVLEIDAARQADRSDTRRVGKEWVSTCRSRWLPFLSKKKI